MGLGSLVLRSLELENLLVQRAVTPALKASFSGLLATAVCATYTAEASLLCPLSPPLCHAEVKLLGGCRRAEFSKRLRG